jgi:hypothetical protein
MDREESQARWQWEGEVRRSPAPAEGDMFVWYTIRNNVIY